jgi:spore maturation protein CgeB
MKVLFVARCDYSMLTECMANAFAQLGHDVSVFDLKKYRWCDKHITTTFSAGRLAACLRRSKPAMIFVVAPMFLPLATIAVMGDYRRRQGGVLAGWIGDVFTHNEESAAKISPFDRLYVSDTYLLSHMALDQGAYLPLATDPALIARAPGARTSDCLFIASRTDNRSRFLGEINRPVKVFGPGWRAQARTPSMHQYYPHALPLRRVFELYERSAMVLNLKNEAHVVNGLNQRSFDPCLAGAVLLHDYIADLELHFDPGREIIVFRDAAEFEVAYDRVLGDASFARRVAEAGQRRVRACHTFQHRAQHVLQDLHIKGEGPR